VLDQAELVGVVLLYEVEVCLVEFADLLVEFFNGRLTF